MSVGSRQAARSVGSSHGCAIREVQLRDPPPLRVITISANQGCAYSLSLLIDTFSPITFLGPISTLKQILVPFARQAMFFHCFLSFPLPFSSSTRPEVRRGLGRSGDDAINQELALPGDGSSHYVVHVPGCLASSDRPTDLRTVRMERGGGVRRRRNESSDEQCECSTGDMRLTQAAELGRADADEHGD